MKAEEEEIDPYTVLGLGVNCSRVEVSKTARKLGLKYHPDKNPDPAAEVKFLEVQKAKDLLLDDERRKEYDSKRLVKEKRKHYDEKRTQGMDDRRKKFKADLEKKISKSGSSSTSSSSGSNGAPASKKSGTVPFEKHGESATASSTLSKADMEKRAKGEKILDEMLEHRKRMSANASVFPSSGAKDFEQAGLEPEATDIKVKWKRTGTSHSEDTLYALFKEFGQIEEVRISGSKGTSAIISFRGGKEVAQKAVDAFVNREEFRVSLLMDDKDVKKKAAVFTRDFDTVNVDSRTTTHSSSSSSSSNMLGKGVTGMSRSVEMALVKDIRRAVERRNLLKAAEAAERAQGDRGSDEALPSDISALQNITYDELIEMEQSLLARLQAAP